MEKLEGIKNLLNPLKKIREESLKIECWKNGKWNLKSNEWLWWDVYI